jgi:predicted RNA-binding protein with RPS1 domain
MTEPFGERIVTVLFFVVVCLSACAEGLLSSLLEHPVARTSYYYRNGATFKNSPCLPPRLDACVLHSTASENEVDEKSTASENEVDEKSCFWKPKALKSHWQQRVNLKDLEVGQKLSGYLVQDLLTETKTGPKLYFECGVGRTNGKGKWSIVNGMLRLGRGKLSVAKKRSARYRKKDAVDLYVSRIQTGCGRLEVCGSFEEAQMLKKNETLVSVASLKPDQEVRGTIVKLLPYGAMVDVGANRLGLLHIQKVADLFGKYVDKEQGMKKFGIEPKARVRLVVESVEKRRLALDFTPDVKKDAEEERKEEELRDREEKRLRAAKANAQNTLSPSQAARVVNAKTKKAATTTNTSNASSTSSSSQEAPQMSADELAQWAEYASQGDASQAVDPSETEYDDDDNDDEEEDEDRDLEDAFGLGTY